jgi:hypothetical protein
LIKAGDPLPTSFETRRQQAERQERQRRGESLRRLEDEMKTSYEDHCKVVLERFITEELGHEEFQKRVERRKAELLHQGGFLDGMSRPEVVDGFAIADVRRSLITGVVSYDDFCRRQLPATLERLGLDAAALGLQTSN